MNIRKIIRCENCGSTNVIRTPYCNGAGEPEEGYWFFCNKCCKNLEDDIKGILVKRGISTRRIKNIIINKKENYKLEEKTSKISNEQKICKKENFSYISLYNFAENIKTIFYNEFAMSEDWNEDCTVIDFIEWLQKKDEIVGLLDYMSEEELKSNLPNYDDL